MRFVASEEYKRTMGNAENSALPQMSHRAQIANPFRAMVFGAMADEMIAAGTDVVKLSLGEPDFGAPPAVRDAMREQYDGRPLPYTAAMGLPELRQAISDFYKERHHVDVDPKRIAITAGGSTALLLAAALTVNEGDEVLIADPSYPCNRELVRAFGGEVVDVPTNAATRFHLTPELCREYWSDRTKAVMITSPSNPTGTTIAFDTLKSVCDLAKERGAWRIVDETYLDLADREPDGSDVKSVLACDPDAIVCSSFSKFFGMTGWRLGGWSCLNARSKPWTTSPPTSSCARIHPPSMRRSRASLRKRWPCARNAVRSCWNVVALWSTDWLRSVCRWKLSRMARSMRISIFPALVLMRGRSVSVR